MGDVDFEFLKTAACCFLSFKTLGVVPTGMTLKQYYKDIMQLCDNTKNYDFQQGDDNIENTNIVKTHFDGDVMKFLAFATEPGLTCAQRPTSASYIFGVTLKDEYAPHNVDWFDPGSILGFDPRKTRRPSTDAMWGVYKNKKLMGYVARIGGHATRYGHYIAGVPCPVVHRKRKR